MKPIYTQDRTDSQIGTRRRERAGPREPRQRSADPLPRRHRDGDPCRRRMRTSTSATARSITFMRDVCRSAECVLAGVDAADAREEEELAIICLQVE